MSMKQLFMYVELLVVVEINCRWGERMWRCEQRTLLRNSGICEFWNTSTRMTISYPNGVRRLTASITVGRVSLILLTRVIVNTVSDIDKNIMIGKSVRD